MQNKDLTHNLNTNAASIEIDPDALHIEIDEAALDEKRNGGGEAIIPTDKDNTCDSGSCIL